MCILERDELLEDIEKNSSPLQIVKWLYNRWAEDRSNFQYFLRIGIQCWLNLAFMSLEEMDQDKSATEMYYSYLSETFAYGLAHFQNEINFLCLYGYMIKLYPYFFTTLSGDYDKDFDYGEKMIQKAFLNNSQHPVAALLVEKPNTQEWLEKRIKLKSVFKCLFPGESEADIYFNSVWGGSVKKTVLMPSREKT